MASTEDVTTDTAGSLRRTFPIFGPELITFGVIAAITYTALRIVYAQHYAEFNVEPEDVGLGQVELIRQAVAGPAILVAVLAAVVTLLLFTFALSMSAAVAYVRLLVGIMKLTRDDRSAFLDSPYRLSRAPTDAARFVRDLLDRLRSIDQDDPDRARVAWRVASMTLPLAVEYVGYDVRRSLRRMRPVIWSGPILAVIAVGSWVTWRADVAADEARDGIDTFHVLDLELGWFRLPVLDVQALPVAFASMDAEKPLPPALSSACLLYLGSGPNGVVVFDVRERSTHRFPSGGLSITVDDGALPEGCRPP